MKMHLKNNNKKKKYKYLLYIVIIYLIFSYTFYNLFKDSSLVSNKEFIKYILNNGNANFNDKYKLPDIVNYTFNYIFKIDFSNPSSILSTSLNYDDIEINSEEELDKLKEISSYIESPFDEEVKEPLIYIYNTHQLENYDNYNLDIYGITPNVLMASYLLKDKLKDKGISSIVEDTNITEFLSVNKWNYASSYKASRIFILDKKNTYPSIKYFIDIHRDSVKKEVSTVNINNKKYARILFVVGLEHKNYKKNLELANTLNNISNSKYKGLSRGVLKKEGEGVNGIYNQDISENVMLIEVGGYQNNIDEVLNTVNALSDILSIYIGEYEKD